MRKRVLLGGIAALWLASGAAGQQPEPRPLEVPATASWMHASTSLILPPRIASLARTSLHDNGTRELDVTAQYGDEGDSLFATVYLFRSQIPNVPVWFDRARTVIEELPDYDISASDAGPVHGLAVGDAETARALSVAYPLDVRGLRSTALAVAPANGWMVKVRLSSRELPPAALEQKLVEFMKGISWPQVAEAEALPAAAPVAPCRSQLSYQRARQMKPDLTRSIFGSLLASVAASKPNPVVAYCRESNAGIAYGVYRPVGNEQHYVMALADSGRAISVGKTSDITDPDKSHYSVSMLDLARSGTYPSFDRLPKPEQVMELVSETSPFSSVQVGTNEVTIDGSAVE